MAPTAGTRLRYKTAKSKKPHQAKKVPSLKNRIRGLERFLKRGGIPDATRRAKKEELKQLQDEHKEKEQVELEKKNAEKYKRPRFFERVKVMRKLKQTKARIEKAESKADRAKQEKLFQTYREEMMYIYYYPKSEPYLSLFPPAPHSAENQKRQRELRAEALDRFAMEQSTEAFHQFCFNDGKGKSVSAGVAEARPAVELLLKKPTKEMVKKQKKTRSKRDKTGDKAKHTPALVDQDDDDMSDASKSDSEKEGQQEEAEEEEDDFFM